MGSTVFIIPSDVIKSSDYRPQILYTSSGIINPVDPLASAYNLYIYRYRCYISYNIMQVCILILRISVTYNSMSMIVL